MPHCNEMKEGQIYYCDNCGLEIEVAKECKECSTPVNECECGDCSFICCDHAMKKKE